MDPHRFAGHVLIGIFCIFAGNTNTNILITGSFLASKKISQMFWWMVGIVLPLRITQMRKTDVKYSSANDY